MGKRRDRAVAWGGALLLLGAHVGLRPTGTEPVLGWLPPELVLRLAWIGGAWLWLLFVTARLWPAGGEE